MVQVKLFVSLESDVRDLENEMNAWLSANTGVRIVRIFGNIAPQTITAEQTQLNKTGRRFAPSDLFMAVVYDDSAG